MADAPPPRLRCVGIRKRYPGVLALDDVDFELAPGSVHALVGENGAGKSTLVKVLSGAVTADAGYIEIEGKPATIRDARAAADLGIAVVHQEFNLVPDLSVSENIFLGRWPSGAMVGLVDFGALAKRTSDLLDSLRISLPLKQTVRELSVAGQQMVEIAKALSLDARILILDEPSAVLTPHELRTLFALVRDLVARGVSVIYISHRLDEVFEIADTVTVFRDGRRISTRPIADVSRPRLIAEMVGRELSNEFPERDVAMGEVILSVAGLSAEPRFVDVSFDIRRGEVLALTGLVGSGRSSVAQTIFGAIRATSGSVTVYSRRGPFNSPREAMTAGVAMLPEDRKQQGLLLIRNIRENITLADRKAAAVMGFMKLGLERRHATQQMSDLRIKAVSSEFGIDTLSGGNQQKVLLARWMSIPHRLMILDEPTRGVDVGAKYEMYTLMNRLAAEGTAILMITSELPEAVGMADRIGVMCQGRLAGILDNQRHQVSQEEIMHLAAGEVPVG